MNATTKRNRILLALTAGSVLAAFLAPPAPQPEAYHDFADHRIFYGIANALDVASNLGFLLAGIAGLWIVARPATRFDHALERWPYAIFFAGVLLTALGSGYYHLAPDNERLFWDRLPMTIAFMSLLAAQVGDRIDPRAGRTLLLPMLAIGAASVVYWRATERMGVGNVVPYGILQAYSVVILLLIALWLPSRYTRGDDVYWVFACYVVAKVGGAARCADPRSRELRERPHAQARGRGGRRPGRVPDARAPRAGWRRRRDRSRCSVRASPRSREPQKSTASRMIGHVMQCPPPRPRPSSAPTIEMTSMPCLRSNVLV